MSLSIAESKGYSQIVDHRQLVSIGVVGKPFVEEVIRDLWGVDEEEAVSHDRGINQVTLKEVLGLECTHR